MASSTAGRRGGGAAGLWVKQECGVRTAEAKQPRLARRARIGLLGLFCAAFTQVRQASALTGGLEAARGFLLARLPVTGFSLSALGSP